jgi:hypothetical protein
MYLPRNPEELKIFENLEIKAKFGFCVLVRNQFFMTFSETMHFKA